MNRKVFLVIAWSLLAAIVFATLSPIGLRPESGLNVQTERFLAFLLVGGAFALAYPKHFIWAVIFVVGAAIALEVLQHVVPTRHGRAPDLMAKLAGASIGLVMGWITSRVVFRKSAL